MKMIGIAIETDIDPETDPDADLDIPSGFVLEARMNADEGGRA